MQDPLNLYKLIVLYMQDQVDFPLTRVQLFDFVLEKEYTDFFTLQQAIAELIEANLLSTQSDHNSTRLILTEQGKQTISFFENRIPTPIKEEIKAYFAENKIDIKSALSVRADYYKSTGGEYIAQMSVKDGKETVIELSLSAPTQEAAETMCLNWQAENQEIYAYLMQKLL